MNHKLFNRIKKLAQSDWLHHLLFWAFAYFILLNMFSSSSEIMQIDRIYTAIFVATLVLSTEINLLILIPRFLTEKKHLVYFFLLIVTLCGFALFNQILFSRLIDYILPGYYFISYYGYLDILKFFVVFAAVATLLKLSKEWFYLNETRQKLIIAEKEKTDAELKALRSQLNPHFLFNSLNVVYSLSLKNSPDAPKVALQLSDILRYVIYETNEPFVPVKDELNLINNYINLQKHRVSPKTEISFGADIEDEEVRIAPMLLLPLIENSFKHGVRRGILNMYVRISLKANGKSINFSIENNKPASAGSDQPESGGIGLKNIKSRLEIIYPELHEMKIEDSENRFSVAINIYDVRKTAAGKPGQKINSL